MRDMKGRQTITLQRVVNRLEYWSFISGVSLFGVMLLMSALHLFLMFINWSIL